jgi:hypothetical protein
MKENQRRLNAFPKLNYRLRPLIQSVGPHCLAGHLVHQAMVEGKREKIVVKLVKPLQRSSVEYVLEFRSLSRWKLLEDPSTVKATAEERECISTPLRSTLQFPSLSMRFT